jgi:hypothetical protein
MLSKRLLIVALLLFISVGGVGTNSWSRTSAQAQTPAATKVADELSAAEFARLQRELSEEGGYFRSDNFTSNETAYLTVVDKLRQLGATGGAYLGVGPEQNFTYIAKIRPRIAFIVDIRRQAVIQHLMYKAIFHLSPDRTQFLARLLSRPLPPASKANAPASEAAVNEMLTFFSKTPADEPTYTANLAAIRKTIRDDFQVALTEADQASLEYVYKSFRDDGLEIAYRMDGSRGGYFPSLREIIVQTDLQGKLGNFLVNAEDYEFVRNLHRKNLIIPIVGNFAGKKALSGVGDYLRKNGFTLTAFYTSNVEQYLFEGDLFNDFANNVRKLPMNERTLFIRSATGRYSHPARLPNHRAITLLQQMSVFVKDFDEGKYQTYRDLVSTNYIAPEQP